MQKCSSREKNRLKIHPNLKPRLAGRGRGREQSPLRREIRNAFLALPKSKSLKIRPTGSARLVVRRRAKRKLLGLERRIHVVKAKRDTRKHGPKEEEPKCITANGNVADVIRNREPILNE